MAVVLTIGATWDPAMAALWGKAMGAEFKAKVQVASWPRAECREGARVAGTSSMSREDPLLGSMLVGPAIKGIQSSVIATAKHYILNNQEWCRGNMSADVRVRHEIYHPPFEAAVQACVGSIMCGSSFSGE